MNSHNTKHGDELPVFGLVPPIVQIANIPKILAMVGELALARGAIHTQIEDKMCEAFSRALAQLPSPTYVELIFILRKMYGMPASCYIDNIERIKLMGEPYKDNQAIEVLLAGLKNNAEIEATKDTSQK